jgi:hypothetical protein
MTRRRRILTGAGAVVFAAALTVGVATAAWSNDKPPTGASECSTKQQAARAESVCDSVPAVPAEPVLPPAKPGQTTR